MDSMDEKENLNSSLFSRRSFLATSLMALPSLKALSAISRAPKADQNWPEFRGPGARGVANGYPTRASWNVDSSSCKTSGLLWRIDVPGLSHSSPIIWGDQLFIATVVKLSGKATLRTGYYGDVRTAKDNDQQKWTVLCFDKKTGKKRWEHTVKTGKPATERHEKSSHANTTLVTDGRKLLAFFGSEGLYCFDLTGKLLWSKDLGVINNSWHGIGWGYSSSPALNGDRIALLCDDPANPFIAAYNLADGKEIWRTSRKGACEGSWGTPFILNDGAHAQVVTNGWPFIVSYDLKSGQELWRLRGGGDIPIPTPFVAEGLIVLSNAHGGKAPLFVVRPSAKGDISLPEGKTSSDAVVWSVPNGGSYISTPIVYGDYLYNANFNGLFRCFEFKTGRKVYENRLGVDSACSASLVAANGKIYCPTEEGVVHVVKAGPTLEVLAKNEMGEPCLATPAISQGVLYFRTSASLMAIG